jgi:hypothetical protein
MAKTARPAGSPKGTDLAPRLVRPVAQVKVRALKNGYYNNEFRRDGDVFLIDGALPGPEAAVKAIEAGRDPKMPQAFSKKWMVLAEPDDDETTTGPNAAIERQRRAIASGHVSARPLSEPEEIDDDPLGARV